MSSILAQVQAKASSSTRLISLDVLRGVTVALMIAVNNPGDSEHAFKEMRHSEWNGFTVTDLVFPAFLFIVGISIVFSFEPRLIRGEARTAVFVHSLRRAVILFMLGLVVNGFPFFDLESLRIYGVLQRIAMCFLCVAVLYLWDHRPDHVVVMVTAILLGYWILMRWVPVPGFGLPGRDLPVLDQNGNLAAWLDRLVMPAGRLLGRTRDPEGLLSDLPSVATTLLGLLTGLWLRTSRTLPQKVVGMLASGALMLVLALVWNRWFPINKNLWTSSYVLYAAGWTLLSLAFCIWAIEIKEWKRGWTTLWLVFGGNAITAYVFSELLTSTLYAIPVHAAKGQTTLQQFLYTNIFAPIGNPGFASLLYSICFLIVCAIPIGALYRRQIYIKI